jgi:hypothetical protein
MIVIKSLHTILIISFFQMITLVRDKLNHSLDICILGWFTIQPTDLNITEQTQVLFTCTNMIFVLDVGEIMNRPNGQRERKKSLLNKYFHFN